MIVRHPSELDAEDPDWYPLRENGYHGGCIGSEVERYPDDKPRRPIGFRMPERETEPPATPDWLLI